MRYYVLYNPDKIINASVSETEITSTHQALISTNYGEMHHMKKVMEERDGPGSWTVVECEEDYYG